MAWRFKLTAKTDQREERHPRDRLLRRRSSRAAILHQHDFTVEPGALKPEVVGAIRGYGRSVRDRRAEAEALGASFTVGEDAPV